MKISKHLSKELTKKIEGDFSKKKVRKTLEKTLNIISEALTTNQEKRQTIVKKDGTLSPLFLSILKIDENTFTDKIKKELGKEMISNTQSEGYIKFEKCVLTFKNNKLIMENTKL